MSQSRRSLYGLFAGLAAATAASKVVAAPKPSAPEYVPIVGEVRTVFSHYCAGTMVTNPGHTHGKYVYGYGFSNSSDAHQHSWSIGSGSAVPVAITKLVKWDGSKWVDVA